MAMTKKEIAEKTNDELVLNLCRMMRSYAVYKKDIQNAERICKELENRGVITGGEALFRNWERAYKA